MTQHETLRAAGRAAGAVAGQDEAGADDRVTPDAKEMRAEVMRTREELGRTIEALVAKADVKAAASRRLDETRRRAKATGRRVVDETKQRRTTLGAAGAVMVAAAVAGLLVWRRRHDC